jgi:tubulin--tyrosine ligase
MPELMNGAERAAVEEEAALQAEFATMFASKSMQQTEDKYCGPSETVQPKDTYCGPSYTLVPMKYGTADSKLGSLFTSVTECILQRPWWVKKKSAAGRFHAVLGECQGGGIPFKRISACKDMYGIVPMVNFYRGFKVLCRKAMMVTTLREYCKEQSIDFATLAPPSFIFYPAKPDQNEEQEFIDAFRSEAGKSNGKSVWILKPSDGGKGQNIKVMDDEQQILDHINAQSEGSIAWVVQKYIERPLLVTGGRKFDIRVWVMLMPDYSIHVYQEGVLRTGCTSFSLDDLEDDFTHLSNHCIQINHPDYGKHEPTNEMWYSEFDTYLREISGGEVELRRDILPQINDIVVHTLLAGKEQLKLDETASYSSFNLFGYDFMVDTDYNVTLIEVNSSPAVAEKLLPKLTEDLVQIVFDSAYPPPEEAVEGGFVAECLGDGKRSGENLFELVYSPNTK